MLRQPVLVAIVALAVALTGCPKFETDPVAAGNVSPCTAVASDAPAPPARYPAPPRNDVDPAAGIDLSPAMASFLEIDGVGKVSWRFVDQSDVPYGPWSVITTKPR
jgi:hypothetical protein